MPARSYFAFAVLLFDSQCLYPVPSSSNPNDGKFQGHTIRYSIAFPYHLFSQCLVQAAKHTHTHTHTHTISWRIRPVRSPQKRCHASFAQSPTPLPNTSLPSISSNSLPHSHIHSTSPAASKELPPISRSHSSGFPGVPFFFQHTVIKTIN